MRWDWKSGLAFLVMLVQYLLLQATEACMKQDAFSKTKVMNLGIPYWVVWVYYLLAVGVQVLFYKTLNTWRSRQLSSFSIKESLDWLPEGLCYYRPDGLPKLVNRKMQEISLQITGRPLLNADAFWQFLCQEHGHEKAVSLQGEENPVWQLEDGTTLSFLRRKTEVDHRDIYEILSVDITKEYKVAKKLRKKGAKESEINRRLRQVSRNLTQMTIEQEVLGMKISVHDNLGQVLLQTKRILKNRDRQQEENVLKQWGKIVRLMGNERPENWQDAYVEAFRKTSLLGVRIQVNADLPESKEARTLINMAVTACATNVIRHAKGDEIEINGAKNEDVYTVVITNNGQPPKQKVRESGGLKNLRDEVERFGGVMKIQSKPRFALILILPNREVQ
ncbi:MAG: hypothetical protein K6E75_04540 [Lachnospiraceae bacterium]|nr:hypothetical protein [Lachnospiraceae bacterium]